MLRIASILVSITLFLNSFLYAAPKSISTSSMLDKATTSSTIGDKPQIAKDLEGLDPREGGFSQGLRGSFVVKHYISGPYKGGTAVIEVASDLSYAEIRIFNDEQHLQRVYSIQPKAQSTRINAAKIQNPIRMVEQVRSDDAAQGRTESINVSRSPAREAAVQAQTERAYEAERREREEIYATRMRPGTVSNRAGDIREAEPVARETSSAIQSTASRETAIAVSSAPRKRVIRVRKKRPAKSRSSLDTPLSGSPAPSKDEYYYEEVVVWEKPRPEKQVEKAEPVKVAKAEPPAPPPPPPSATRSSRSTSREETVTHEIARAPSTPAGTAAYSESELPDVAEAVSENEKEDGRGKEKDRAREREREKEQARQREAEPEVVAKPPPKEEAKPIQVVELPGSAVPLPTSKPVPSEEPVIEDIREAQKAASKLDNAADSWSPKETTSKPTDEELGITDMNKASARRGQSLTRPAGQNYDDMVGMSDDIKRSGQVGAGDTWAPSNAPAKLSPTEARAQALLNNLKTPESGRVTKINRDVNNPEEGVLPFYSLEKYSGAQYGRHREFERKVVYKQNPKSPVKSYDFYMDEVDRKEEKHYLYYYKIDSKTKKAKLIATEKHEKVTFLSNYDIGSEDKGKIKYE